MIIETARLLLRPWRDSDRAPYAEIIGDPVVRRYFPTLGTRQEADEGIDRAIAKAQENGFHFQAAELKGVGFIGLIGIARMSDEVSNAILSRPQVEIGWQLSRHVWGQGLAPEGASAWLAHAWEIGLPEVVAVTAAANLPSRRVMEKVGMRRDAEADFRHPLVAAEHALNPHVTYRITRPS